MKLKQIGEVGVDSGHIVIADPGVVGLIEYKDWFTGQQIARQMEWGISCASGHGDGDYPIYAVYDDEGDYVGVLVWFFDDVLLPFEAQE